MHPFANLQAKADFVLSTKAQTLFRLRPLLRKAVILPSIHFSVAKWLASPEACLKQVRNQFGNRRLIVRSSTLAEDSFQQSFAGAFASRLNVDGSDLAMLTQTIGEVIASFDGKNPQDQVLIQPMLSDIAVSGVIMTRTLNEGAPYYVINYDDESGQTDTVTGGTIINKTVLIHHQATTDMLMSARVRQWFLLIQELETLVPGVPLDIEFAQNHQEQLFLLQVRPMTISQRWKADLLQTVSGQQKEMARTILEQSKRRSNLLGEKTFLGEMTDWNPAEMIGTLPRPLAASLYRELITDSTWRDARAAMGYREPADEPLMILLEGRPYIDIRNSFNSFLPASLDNSIGKKIVNAWLARLDQHPELHDKVEFEIAQTVLDFNFSETFRQRYPNVLNAEEEGHYEKALGELTCKLVSLEPTGTLKRAFVKVQQLEDLQKQAAGHPGEASPQALKALLLQCKTLGTHPFAIIARHAFIAEALLRSAVMRNALSQETVNRFKRSLHTVTAQMSEDLTRVANGTMSRGNFLGEYGHLRPGTYDIRSRRYDQRPEVFQGKLTQTNEAAQPATFCGSQTETLALESLLAKHSLGIQSASEFWEYCRLAIVGREHAKFIFTRSLSDALEKIARWGAENGLDRESVSQLSIEEILDSQAFSADCHQPEHFSALIAQRQREQEGQRNLKLGYLIRSMTDLYVIPLHRSAPNFITNYQIEGKIMLLDQHLERQPETLSELSGRIIGIENADPGFDWIFSCGIAGLITKFGGSNSHMAIRCAEFDLPAAIGCGEHLFDRLIRGCSIELNCADRIIRPSVHA